MSDADLPRRRLTLTHWREHRWVTTAAPAGAALGTWLVLVLLALPIRHRFGPHALSAGHQALPLALGVLLVLGAGILLIRRPVTPVLAGVLLGAMAGWVSFSLLVILAGTPFPSGGMYGDCGRTVAAAQ
ncbi:MAG: hypothetical protein QOC82_3108, partial [Frankiaceae bacterium]|nr:hypothetical protein [Frankiaceae bacterium]